MPAGLLASAPLCLLRCPPCRQPPCALRQARQLGAVGLRLQLGAVEQCASALAVAPQYVCLEQLHVGERGGFEGSFAHLLENLQAPRQVEAMAAQADREDRHVRLQARRQQTREEAVRGGSIARLCAGRQEGIVMRSVRRHGGLTHGHEQLPGLGVTARPCPRQHDDLVGGALRPHPPGRQQLCWHRSKGLFGTVRHTSHGKGLYEVVVSDYVGLHRRGDHLREELLGVPGPLAPCAQVDHGGVMNDRPPLLRHPPPDAPSAVPPPCLRAEVQRSAAERGVGSAGRLLVGLPSCLVVLRPGIFHDLANGMPRRHVGPRRTQVSEQDLVATRAQVKPAARPQPLPLLHRVDGDRDGPSPQPHGESVSELRGAGREHQDRRATPAGGALQRSQPRRHCSGNGRGRGGGGRRTGPGAA
mmetsp:Transcript_5848/g.17389  ORF Transcript_5848/g.17389 Transcript_5848/m.17389 type:complete len:415 (+) Transcript_5848:54-1298(+)